MKPGDIVLIRFPQADLQTGKLRPALVVAIAPNQFQEVLLAYITSRTYQAISGFDDVISLSDIDYPHSGLKVSSLIRPGRLATVEASLINARLGRIGADRLQRIRMRISDWLLK